jgi:hypothetical protein
VVFKLRKELDKCGRICYQEPDAIKHSVHMKNAVQHQTFIFTITKRLLEFIDK